MLRVAPRNVGLESAMRAAGSSLKYEKDIGQEQQGMNQALQDIGASAGKGDGAEEQGQQQQYQIAVLHPQNDRAARQMADQQHGGDGQPDGGQHRPQEDVHRALQMIAEGCAGGADRFWG